MMRFYTNPSFANVEWPYVMLGAWLWKKHLSKKTIDNMEHLIIDCSVDKWFFKDRRDSYPQDYLDSYTYKAKMFSRLFPGAWVTIPDYPDDYESGLCWKDGKDNVERTFENIERFSQKKGVNWIYPLQSRFLDYDSFRNSAGQLQSYDPGIIGIGTVCKTNDLSFITKCAKEARKQFPDSWIHAFGPTLRSLPYIHTHIDSFDSSAFYYKVYYSRITVKDKAILFHKWLARLEQLTNNRKITEWRGEDEA